MIRILLVMLGLLSACGIRSQPLHGLYRLVSRRLKSTAIAWLFSRAGRVSPLYSCMVGEPITELGDDRWNHRRVAFGSLQ
jgi:hypothetical protein